METFLLLVAPVIGLAILILLPFYSGTGEKSYRRRPLAVVVVLMAFLTVGLLAYLGTFAPWSPHMEAWSSAVTPADYVKGRSPLELHGAILIQSKQCRNCHSLGGEGGQRGPALDTVATRLTPDQMIRQVIQGSGNMPAYGKNLRPAEVTALVAFMQTLRPSYQPGGQGFHAAAQSARRHEQLHEPVARHPDGSNCSSGTRILDVGLENCFACCWPVGALYFRGWLRLHSELPRKYTIGKLAAFAGGLLALLLALASPVDAFGQLLLSGPHDPASVADHGCASTAAAGTAGAAAVAWFAAMDLQGRAWTISWLPGTASKLAGRWCIRWCPGSPYRLPSSFGICRGFMNWRCTRRPGIRRNMPVSFGRPSCFGGR